MSDTAPEKLYITKEDADDLVLGIPANRAEGDEITRKAIKEAKPKQAEAIKHAAIKCSDTRQGVGRDHSMVFQSQPKGFFKNGVQGFVTTTGRFVDRREARTIAIAAKQIPNKHAGDILISEELWHYGPYEWNEEQGYHLPQQADKQESCPRCHGFGQIEQGGDSVECGVCEGTGEPNYLPQQSEKIANPKFDPAHRKFNTPLMIEPKQAEAGDFVRGEGMVFWDKHKLLGYILACHHRIEQLETENKRMREALGELNEATRIRHGIGEARKKAETALKGKD